MTHLLLSVIYLSFISLGLPDSLLGSAWPSMYLDFGVTVSAAGVISVIISLGTILSSLFSGQVNRRLGTGKVTALSVGLTAAALFGFSISGRFWQLCLWAVPYGLGAGSVDAALNNYVALHYGGKHMSWLHCMWGLGASIGPYIMGYALSGGRGWNGGYRYIALLQICLTLLLLLSLPLWKKTDSGEGESGKPLPIREVLKLPGVRSAMVTFFCYCALEQTAALWAGSYLAFHAGFSADEAASWASLFFVGITVGRAISGFLTVKLTGKQLVRLGLSLVAVGVAALLLPLGQGAALVGLGLVGLGCAPIYPSLIHATPTHFGAERSQTVMGLEIASSYVGTCLAPAAFGLLAGQTGTRFLPLYLLFTLALMTAAHHRLLRRTA